MYNTAILYTFTRVNARILFPTATRSISGEQQSDGSVPDYNNLLDHDVRRGPGLLRLVVTLTTLVDSKGGSKGGQGCHVPVPRYRSGLLTRSQMKFLVNLIECLG